MKKVCLALDLATKSGFALWEPGISCRLGTFTMPPADGQMGRSLHKFAEWLTNFIKISGVTHVQYEKPYLKPSNQKRQSNGTWKMVNGTSQQAAQVLYSLSSRTEEICYALGIPCFECKVADWRNHFIGCNPKRHIAHIKTREELAARGIAFKGQDQADAMGQLIFMAHCMGETPDWPVGKHRGTFQDKSNLRAAS